MRHWKLWHGNNWLLAGLLLLVSSTPDAVAQTSAGTSKPCKATAAAPSKNEGQLSELSCDLSGNLRTSGGGGGGGDGAINDGVSSSIKATVFDRVNSNPVATQLVDSNGDPASIGGGTQYTEDAASVADPVGTQTICRRRDTLASETTADGDNTASNCTAKGELYIKHVDAIPVTQSGAWSVTANAGTNLNTSALLLDTTLTGRFPAAFSSADNIAAQTATAVHGLTYIWDGANWDRWTGAVSVTGSVTIGTFPDNEPFNLAQVNGATTQVATNGLNTTGAGLLASALGGQCDDTAPTALTENQFGHARINCTTHHVLTQVAAELPAGTQNIGDVDIASLPNEGQQTAANSISVTPDTDNDSIGATGAAPPGEATFVGGLTSGATGGFLTGFAVCDSFVNVNVSTATTTLLVTGVSGRHVRLCSISLVTAAANNVALISGTGATCGTGTTGMNGGTTAASGWNFAANGGLTQGSGLGAINQTNATGDSVCIVTSAATQLSGRLSYAIY